MCQLSVAYWQLWQNRHACTDRHLQAATVPLCAVVTRTRRHGYAEGFGRRVWHTFVACAGSLDLMADACCAAVCSGAGGAQPQGSMWSSAGRACLATCRERWISCARLARYRPASLLAKRHHYHGAGCYGPPLRVPAHCPVSRYWQLLAEQALAESR